MTQNKSFYLNLFGVSEVQMQNLISEGLKTGGSWCDLYFENTIYTDLLLRDGQVGSGGSHIDYGCGIRVLNGEKTGYAYAETTEYSALKKAASAAGAIAEGSSPQSKTTAATPQAEVHLPYSQRRDWRDSGAAEFVPALLKLESLIRSKEPSTFKVLAMLSWNVSDVMMYNSLGELTYDTRPCGSISVQVIYLRGDRSETGTASRSFRVGSELISDALLEEIASEAVAGVDALFEARRPKGGKMPVVMAAGASGILLHEAMGHAFEADFNRKGQSIFADKMGKRVAKSGINIIDDGTIDGNRGACTYDDEGIPGQKTYMVRDGVLSSYLHDRISAAFYGVAPTGNGRRESFRYNPIPRMRCTYMESGTDGTLGDLIHSVKKGIYVDKFSNGQVKIGEGDFTFFVKSGALIENGTLTMPIKDINIIGNGPQALADISAVAADLKIDNGTWTCGKEQSVPVSCGIPSVLVNNLIVGGE